MDFIESMEWRYAVKVFNADKKLTEEQISYLISAANLTATSYGLQPNKIVRVKNTETRAKLVEHSYGQKQVSEASDLLVICSEKKYTENKVDDYADRIVETRSVSKDSLSGMVNMIKGFVGRMDVSETKNWTVNQAYIVLGNLLAACAVEGIDSCPIAGFIPSKYDEILDLEKEGLTSVLVLPIGYRDESDKYSEFGKIRMKNEEFIIER
ncbi:MAG: nitroreductase family protein [Ichthyobacteriaceae bacterium]|nr:nitroreductase family protein [Ichthyobacteriaceae bacterium]